MSLKKRNKTILFLLTIFVFLGIINVNADDHGYTYDSNQKPIYSTDGFVAYDFPYTYPLLGISNESTAGKPADLFVYDKEEYKEDPIIYLTDSALNAFYVFDQNLSTESRQDFTWFKLIPSKLQNTTATAIRSCVYESSSSSSKLLFASSDDVPTDKQLNDPEGEYGGKGYVELRLREPASVYRAYTKKLGKDLIYVCDKGNSQVVILDADTYDEETKTYEIYQVITKPTDELESNVSFAPKKVITDTEGRVYIIADGVTEGIMQFSVEGEFARYTGTNEITLSAWDIFWRNFSSENQLAKKQTLYNTTFNAMVYKDDMIYTTSLAILNSDGTKNSNVMIKKINPSGDDILHRNGYSKPKGDVQFSEALDGNAYYDDRGPSQLVGITVNDYGVYSVVDRLRGRIFTYDNEGNLLYISGGKGTQADKLSDPVAIQYLGENLLVLDANNKTIIKFEPTAITKIINKAVEKEHEGVVSRTVPLYNDLSKSWWIGEVNTKLGNKKAVIEEKEGIWYIDGTNTGVEAEEYSAAEYWEQVITLNANYEYAYVGIGHKYMREENYEAAMKYFKLGKNRVYYSKAFKQYRDGIIKEWFAPVVVTLAVLIIGSKTYKYIKNKRLGIRKDEETGVGDE